MDSKQYLTLCAEVYEEYVEENDHRPGQCQQCDVARLAAKVARNMIRDKDYPEDVGQCVKVYNDNVMFVWEQARPAGK